MADVISDEERKKQRANLAKRSASGMEKSYTDKNREALEKATASMAPPLITVKQCNACMSERRLWIEQMLLQGLSYSAISKALAASGEHVDRRTISHHSKEHMAVQDAVTRAVMEQEADLLGQQYEEGVQGAFSMRGALHVLIRKAFNDAMNNVTTVEPRDMIQMIRSFNEMESSSSVTAVEEAKMAVRLFMEAIQNVTADELTPEEGERIRIAISAEVKRLRSRDEIDIEVEKNLKQLPHGTI